MQKAAPQHPLRAWRETQNLSLRALAARLCDAAGAPLVSYVTLQRIEAGAQEAPWDVVRALHALSEGALDANHFMMAPRDGRQAVADAGR
jgi:hypothetical protein